MRASFYLLKDLKSELEKQFASKRFDSSQETAAGGEEQRRSPSIWIGHAPPKKSLPKDAPQSASGDPPFVIVRSLKGEIRNESDKARVHDLEVGFLCCVYSKESYEEIEAGYNHIMNMIDNVLEILNSRLYWANNSWRMSEPARWTMGLPKESTSIYEAGMQEHPFYGAAVTASFIGPAIERAVPTNLLQGGQ